MSTITVTKADDSLETFEDTIGHQIGNGAVQIMNMDGTQVIFNNFKEVFIDLSQEEKDAFKKRMEDAEASAQSRMDSQSEARPTDTGPGKKDSVVALNS